MELLQHCVPSQTLSMMCQYVQQSLMRLAVQIILTSLPRPTFVSALVAMTMII